MSLLRPRDIKSKKFKSGFNGYRKDEVEKFIKDVYLDYQELYIENLRLYEETDDLKIKVEDYAAKERMLEEAKKRDHRKIGKEMKLYMFRDEAPGFPFYLPNGMILRNALINYWEEVHDKWGNLEVLTPQIMKRTLWETSGHWYHYKENMYTVDIDEQQFAIKPMNCPGGMLFYNAKQHSYKELPIRAAELGRVHRHELSGALH